MATFPPSSTDFTGSHPSHYSINYVWEVNTLTWVREEQSGGSSGGGGPILDGVDPAIKATVFDFTNSNPLATVLVDANGDPVFTGVGTVTANQGTPAITANRWPVQLTDGTDLVLVTAAGEINVLATAQPGVDIGDVTINNAAGGAAVNIQDGGNSVTVDGVFFQATQPISAAALPLPTGATTATTSNVAASAVSVMLVADAATRLGLTIYNDANKKVYVKFGTTASTVSFTRLMFPQEYWQPPPYSGRIDAIWEAGPTGSMRVTELTV